MDVVVLYLLAVVSCGRRLCLAYDCEGGVSVVAFAMRYLLRRVDWECTCFGNSFARIDNLNRVKKRA